MNYPLSRYIITKSLQKAPKDYPDAKGLPHVKVANDMLKERKTVCVILELTIDWRYYTLCDLYW